MILNVGKAGPLEGWAGKKDDVHMVHANGKCQQHAEGERQAGKSVLSAAAGTTSIANFPTHGPAGALQDDQGTHLFSFLGSWELKAGKLALAAQDKCLLSSAQAPSKPSCPS
eukprot:1154736-Pelagomonas_calceolata.AAC.3